MTRTGGITPQLALSMNTLESTSRTAVAMERNYLMVTNVGNSPLFASPSSWLLIRWGERSLISVILLGPPETAYGLSISQMGKESGVESLNLRLVPARSLGNTRDYVINYVINKPSLPRPLARWIFAKALWCLTMCKVEMRSLLRYGRTTCEYKQRPYVLSSSFFHKNA